MRDKYDHVNQDDPSERIVDAFYAKEFIEKRWAEDKSGKVILKADIEQFSPRYNFGKQTIAFKLVSHPTDNVLPRLDFTVKKDTKGNIERNLTKDKTDNEVFIISNYELRNLFVYNHLHQKGDAEKLIREYAENMRRLFYDIKFGQFLPLVAPPHFKKGEKKPFDKNPQRRKQLQDNYTQQQEAMNERRLDLAEILETEYNLPYHALPKDLREYLLAYKDVPYVHAAKEKLTKQFKDVQERQKMVNKQKQPNRGGMATYLAEDIVFMMPPRPHGLDANGDPHYQKLNNDQYRVLQSSIAFFLINRDNIKSFFTELGLNEKDSPYQHPFLHKVNVTRCSGVLHFYSEYLGVKERFLYDAINFIHDEKKRKYANADEVRTRYGHILPINERKAIEKNYDKTPLLLPKGFFNQAIAQAVNAPVKEGFSGFNNVVYNLEYLLNADTQPFYMPDSETQTFLHYYRKPVPNTEGVLIEKTVFMPELETDIQRLADEKRFNKKLKDDEKQVVKNALQETIRIKDFILEREQTLRYHQTNDRAMWLMVKGISDYRFKTNDKEAVSIDFHENGEENPFLLRGIKFIEEAEAKRVADETGATERKIWNVLDKEVKMSLKVSGKRIIDE